MFEKIENEMKELTREDKLELIIDIVADLQGDELVKLINEYKKENKFYNAELRKAENNYYIYENVYNMLCEEIY